MKTSRKQRGVGIKAVAELAGVSPTTVSRVFSNSPIPSQSTREVVLKAATELNYKPDPALSAAIRRRRSGHDASPPRTRMIAFLVSPQMYSSVTFPDGQWYSQVMPGVQKVLDDAGHHLLLTSYDMDQDQLPSSVIEGRVDGLLVWCSLPPHVAAHLTNRLPVVFADRMLPDVRADFVLNHHEKSMQLMLEHLWEQGHRHIVMFDHAKYSIPQELRRRSADRFFASHPMPPALMKLSRPWPVSPEMNDAVVAQFVKELVAVKPRPTAILMGQCALGQHMIQHLNAAGLDVPRDISIASAQDHIRDTYCTPALTSFSVPAYDIGLAATELLLARIQNPDRPTHELHILGKRIDRQSVAPPPASRPSANKGLTG